MGVILPVIVAIINSGTKLNEAFIQCVRHSVDALRHDHICLPICPFQIHNVSLRTNVNIRQGCCNY